MFILITFHIKGKWCEANDTNRNSDNISIILRKWPECKIGIFVEWNCMPLNQLPFEQFSKKKITNKPNAEQQSRRRMRLHMSGINHLTAHNSLIISHLERNTNQNRRRRNKLYYIWYVCNEITTKCILLTAELNGGKTIRQHKLKSETASDDNDNEMKWMLADCCSQY